MALIFDSTPLSRHERQARLAQTATTIWLTGLSGSGKSSLAFALEKALSDRNRTCFVLDGDSIRRGLCEDLGFETADRSENIRRIAQVSRLMNDAGLIVIVAAISPLIDDRALARKIIGSDSFIEIYVNTPLAVCESRDPKGLYKKARQGELLRFTGVSAPYEPPQSPDLLIDNSETPLSEHVTNIINLFDL